MSLLPAMSSSGLSSLDFSKATRLLFFAPHPDDESLAAGGLLQKAVAASAEVRVVFVTSGDDNPWPLRVLERQWKVTAADRLIWAKRRMDEARAALCALGISPEHAHFLHQPDQKLTALFLSDAAEVAAQIEQVLREFQPTHLFAPAPFDTHPDHSALFLLVRQSLRALAAEDIALFGFAIHGRQKNFPPPDIVLPLSSQEQMRKRAAILSHRTQMALSRRRFLRHVRTQENFWSHAALTASNSAHPIRSAQIHGAQLRLSLQAGRELGSLARLRLFIATIGPVESGVRWLLQLPWASTRVQICDAANGNVIARAQVRMAGRQAVIYLPAPTHASSTEFFAKLEGPTLFYDRYGWRELSLKCDEPASVPCGQIALSSPRKA